MPEPTALLRRVRRAAAVLAGTGVAFGAGVVTGVVGSAEPPAAPASATGSAASVVDEAADRIEDRAARAVTREDLERAAVEGMLAELDDRWADYHDPQEYEVVRDAVEGRYSGVGLWLVAGPDGAPVVGSVQPGSPAATAGVQPDERVLAVDGEAASDVERTAALLRGDDGSQPAAVRLRGQGGRERTLSLARRQVVSRDVVTDRPRPDVLSLRVVSFTRGVGQQVRAALAAHPEPAGGVLLDLRGNGGGLLTEAVEVASAFLDGGPVVLLERRGEPLRTLEALGEGDGRTPLVVLVDGGTASAAEVVAVALQDSGRAVVVGGRTQGKGSVQEPERLSDGSALELTVGRYLSPTGRAIEGHGVVPDVLVDAGAPPAAAHERALDVLVGLRAGLLPVGRG